MSMQSSPLRRDTCIFISAVTRELGSVRKLVKKALEDNDHHAIEQDNFPLDYRELVEKLRARIASCDAVVHIAGQCYGAEPAQRPPEAPRRSYTQLEYDIAVELNKPVYVFLTGDAFPCDPHEPEPAEFEALQESHRQRLTATGRDYSRAASIEELDRKVRTLQIKVERLQEELQQVDQQVAVARRRLGRWLALVVVVTIAALGILGFVAQRQQAEQRAAAIERLKQERERAEQERERVASEAARREAQTIDQTQRDFAERFLHQLLIKKDITADEARQRALTELPSLVKLSLAEITSLIDRKIAPRAVNAALSPVDRARAALIKGNYDEVFRAAEAQKQQGRELAMLEGTAALAQFRKFPKPEWNERALAAFRRALALTDPKSSTEWRAWTDAALAAASVFSELARYQEAEPLLRDSVRIREANAGADSKELAPILNDLARLFQATNRLSEAEPLFRRALTIEERSNESDRSRVAIYMDNLAVLLYATNRAGEAESLMRRALAIEERSFGPNHPDVAITLNNLASLLQTTNRMDEAESLMRRALAIEKQSYGPEHPKVATCLNNLGVLFAETNRPREAEPLMRRALHVDEHSYGPDHPAVARDLNNLAGLLKAAGRTSEAEPLMRRALAIDERTYGSGHPEVATDLNRLGGLLEATNRTGEAEPLMRRALTIDEHSYGLDHPKVAADLDILAGLLQATNRLSEAEPLMRRALTIDERSYGPDHPEVATHLNNLGLLLYSTNRLSEAEVFMRRALAIDEHSYGPDHPHVARDLNNLGSLLQATNRLGAAEPLMRRALGINERSYGPDRPKVATGLGNLAGLLQATNRQLEAEPLMRRALVIDERAYGPDHPKVATGLSNLAGSLEATNRLSEAEPLMRRALVIDERAYGPDHPKVATDLNNLAGLLESTNRLSEAEPLMRQALAIDERSYGPDDPYVARDLNNLGSLLRDTNRFSQAEPLLGRSVRILLGFQLSTGHRHPEFKSSVGNYRLLLVRMKMAKPEVEARVKALSNATDKLTAIVPEVERSLGPASPVEKILKLLDREYREQGKPAVYYLDRRQPIAPHLAELLRANPESRAAQGVAAYRSGHWAEAISRYDSALQLVDAQHGQGTLTWAARMGRAAAMRELGLLKEAREELEKLVANLDQSLTPDFQLKGRARYHLAVCHWRLGDRAAATRVAEESLAAYDAAPKDRPVSPRVRRQSEALLEAVKRGKAPAPLPRIDAQAAIAVARAREHAAEALSNLALDRPAVPLLDQLLGPAETTSAVLAALDRDYLAKGKPVVLSLSLKEPISPHLDQLLGRAKP